MYRHSFCSSIVSDRFLNVYNFLYFLCEFEKYECDEHNNRTKRKAFCFATRTKNSKELIPRLLKLLHGPYDWTAHKVHILVFERWRHTLIYVSILCISIHTYIYIYVFLNKRYSCIHPHEKQIFIQSSFCWSSWVCIPDKLLHKCNYMSGLIYFSNSYALIVPIIIVTSLTDAQQLRPLFGTAPVTPLDHAVTPHNICIDTLWAQI